MERFIHTHFHGINAIINYETLKLKENAEIMVVINNFILQLENITHIVCFVRFLSQKQK